MCGIYGFIGSAADWAALDTVAELAARRGPHAHGSAWIDRGAVSVHSVALPYACDRSPVDRASGACAVIGHARLSTSGDWRQPENNQPIPIGRSAIAHNGTVRQIRRSAARLHLRLDTENDSELVGLVLDRFGIEGLKRIEMSERYVLLWLTPERLIARRHGHPLYRWARPEGDYLCSLPPDEEATLIAEDETYIREVKT